VRRYVVSNIIFAFWLHAERQLNITNKSQPELTINLHEPKHSELWLESTADNHELKLSELYSCTDRISCCFSSIALIYRSDVYCYGIRESGWDEWNFMVGCHCGRRRSTGFAVRYHFSCALKLHSDVPNITSAWFTESWWVCLTEAYQKRHLLSVRRLWFLKTTWVSYENAIIAVFLAVWYYT